MTVAAPEPQIARDFALAINTGTDAAPTYTPIGGITNIQPSADSTKTDESDFDSAGRAKHNVVERSDTLQVTMNYKESPTDGSRDPGQQALIDAAALIGPAALKEFQYTYPGGALATFEASVDLPMPGGGKTDNASFAATLTVSGAVTETPAV